jgi:hypothetical protein
MNKPQTKEEWKEYLKSCLDRAQFMALATTGKDGPWISPLYFSYDDAFTLYFISEMSSRHTVNIKGNASVSCAIYSTSQDPREDVVGVQLAGRAYAVAADEKERAQKTYFSETVARRPVASYGEFMEPKGSWYFFKVVPDEIFVFDTGTFGEKRMKLPIL